MKHGDLALRGSHHFQVMRKHETTNDKVRLVLSRFHAAPSARSGHLAFEGRGAPPSQCRMPTAGVTEAVDISEDGGFGLGDGFPGTCAGSAQP